MAESDCNFGRTVFIIVSLLSILVSRSYCNGVDTVDIAVGCTGVVIVSPVPRRPDVDVSVPIPTLHTTHHTHTEVLP